MKKIAILCFALSVMTLSSNVAVAKADASKTELSVFKDAPAFDLAAVSVVEFHAAPFTVDYISSRPNACISIRIEFTVCYNREGSLPDLPDKNKRCLCNSKAIHPLKIDPPDIC